MGRVRVSAIEHLARDDGGEIRVALAQRGEVLDDWVLRVDLEPLVGQLGRGARLDHRHHPAHARRLMADDDGGRVDKPARELHLLDA